MLLRPASAIVITLATAVALASCDSTNPPGSDGSGGADTGGADTDGTASGGTGTGGELGEGGAPSSTGDLVGVETPGADCPVPSLTAFANLPSNAKFPDPFTLLNGSPVTTKAEWVCRHRELSALLQGYETGEKTAKPSSVTGSMDADVLTVALDDGAGETGSFTVTIEYPSGDGPFPAMIGLDGGSIDMARLRERGVATIHLSSTDIRPEGNRSQGLFSSFTGQTSAGALIAWAWGTSRLLDALEVTPEANIRADRVGVTGCSRNGKGALMMGVMDSRIALTIPQESGAGGVAAWRAAEYENQEAPQGCETPDNPERCVQKLSSTYTEQAWFSTSISQFGSAVDKLPVDHHQLIALAAPRGLLALGNIGWKWLGRYGSAQGMSAAREVYRALGAEENIGFVESGHTHCFSDFSGDEQEAIDAFVARFLLDQDVSTAFWSDAIPLESERWVDWSTPTLE